jgi:hypothetical protein
MLPGRDTAKVRADSDAKACLSGLSPSSSFRFLIRSLVTLKKSKAEKYIKFAETGKFLSGWR